MRKVSWLAVLCAWIAAEAPGRSGEAADSLAAALETYQWRITSYFDGAQYQTPDNVIPDATNPAANAQLPWPWIGFANGRIEGTPGCGGMIGDYKVSGDRLMLHVGFLIAGQCNPSLSVQDAYIVRALRDVRRAKPDRGSMVLLDDKGVVQIIIAP